MTATVLKLSAAAAVLAAAVTTGVWAVGPAAPQPGAPPAARPQPKAQPPAGRLADAKQRYRGMQNLKHILLAFHNYHDVNNHFPADITDKDGKPLLSWRVAILPYIDEREGQNLYKQFKLDEPWDGPNNKKLIAKMPEVYRTGIEPRGETKTYYQGFAGPGTIFEPGKKLSFVNVTDGTSNTIAVVEAGPPVEWTKPADIPFDPKKPLPKREGPFKNVLLAATADGAVHAFRQDIPDDAMKLLIIRDDGMIVPDLRDLRPKLVPVGEADAKVARDAVAENARLLKAIVEQMAEQQKLLEDAAKQGRLGDVPDIDRLLERQKQLERGLEEVKKETEALREHLKAKPDK